MKQYLYIIVALLTFHISFYGQTPSGNLISGKVVCNIEHLENISIVNINNNEASVTDKDGLFSIHVKGGDLLVITGDDVELKKKMIIPEDLRKGEIEVELVAVKNMLKEVVINVEGPVINKEETKTYPGTENLYHLGNTGMTAKVENLGVKLVIDPLVDFITGRTKEKKRKEETEKKRKFIEKVGYLFENDFYTKNLEIPAEHIEGFKYFCLDDADFKNYIDKENKSKIRFRVIELSKIYKERVAVGNGL